MAPSATRSSARSPRRSHATSTSISMSRFPSAASATSPGPWRRASRDLRQELDRFSLALGRDGTLARLADRYIPDRGQIQRIDAGVLQERIRTRASAIPVALPRRAGEDRHRMAAARRHRLPGIAVGSRRRPARPACAASCRSPRTPRSTSASATCSTQRRTSLARRALPARPQGQAAGAHPGARPDVARARRLQHRARPSRGRAHPRAEAEAQPRPVERREEGAAAARAPRVLRASEAGLCARRECRWRSSTACAGITTCCSRMPSRTSRACACWCTEERMPRSRSPSRDRSRRRRRNALRRHRP